MIKTSLKFITKNATVTGGENTGGGGSVIIIEPPSLDGMQRSGVLNNAFQYYTDGWSGDTSTSSPIYKSLNNDNTLQSITLIDSWDWIDGWMVAQTGMTGDLYQSLNGAKLDEYYTVTFRVKDIGEGGGVTPSLWGNLGDTVTEDGEYTQIIRVADTGTTEGSGSGIGFNSNGGSRLGLNSISVQGTSSTYTKIDLYDDETFNLTFQIQSNLSNKGSTYSKTIKLPGTQNNNYVFNYLFNESIFLDINNLSGGTQIFLNKKIPAGIYDESIELLIGYFELTRVTVNNNMYEYEGVFYSNIKSIADVIGEKQLIGNGDPNDDIDLSEHNHLFNYTTISDSWTSTGYTTSTGYYYPIIDYGNVKDGNEYYIEQFKPNCYVKEVWDKIFTKAEFTYTSAFLNSDVFKSLVIPQGNNRKTSTFIYENTKFNVGLATDQELTVELAANRTIENNPIGRSDRILFELTSGGTFDNTNTTYDTTNHRWNVNTGGSRTFSFRGGLRFGCKYAPEDSSPYKIDSGGRSVQVKINLYREDVSGNKYLLQAASVYVPIPYNPTQPVYWYPGAFFIPDQSIYVEFDESVIEPITVVDGEKYYIESNCIFVGKFVHYITNAPCPGTLSFMIDKYVNVINESPTHFSIEPAGDMYNYYSQGNKVYMNDVLPENLSQIKFLGSICNKFNLMFTEDKANSKNLIIEPYDQFYYSGTTSHVDWSKKIDISREKWVERIPYLTDKNISFNLASDTNDDYLKRYQESLNCVFGSYTVKNPYYADNEEKVDDDFSPTTLGNYGSTNWIVSRITSGEPWEYGYPTETDYNTRFLYRNYITAGTGFTLSSVRIMGMVTEGLTGHTAILGMLNGSYPYAGHLNNPYSPTFDLNYGIAQYYNTKYKTANNLVWNYWRNKVSQYLNPNSKMVTLYLRLTPSDISLLDFRKKIFLNNNLYKLNKIVEWTPRGNSCKVELIQDSISDPSSYITPTVWQINQVTGGGTGIGDGGGTINNPIPGRSLVLTPRQGIIYPSNFFEISGMTSITDSSYFSGVTSAPTKNFVSPDSASLVIGKGNIVNGISNIVNGDNNKIESDNNTIMGSNDNNVPAETKGVILLNSHGNTFTVTGDTKTVLISSTGMIIGETHTGKTYVNNKEMADTTYLVTYVDSKSGDTLTYVNDNYYTKTTTDTKYPSRGGGFDVLIKTTQTYNSNNEYIIGDMYNGTGRTITLMSTDMIDGKVFILQDARGNANTNNIVIYEEGSGILSTITNNKGFVLLYTDGHNWYGN